jgi:hypothetical protein
MNATTRLAGTVALSALVAAGALLGTASAATAAPTGCSVSFGSNFAQSQCTGGTGEHRVVMQQQHFLPGVGPILCVGPWVPVGSVSFTNCANHTIVSVRVDTR